MCGSVYIQEQPYHLGIQIWYNLLYFPISQSLPLACTRAHRHVLSHPPGHHLSINFKLGDFDHLANLSSAEDKGSSCWCNTWWGGDGDKSSETEALSSALDIGIHSESLSTNNLLLSLIVNGTIYSEMVVAYKNWLCILGRCKMLRRNAFLQ